MHPTATFRHKVRADHEALIAACPFAHVFLQTPEGPRVAHTPVLSTGDGALQFHLARRNALTPHLEGAQALIVFNGPHGYISPRWYDSAEQVPTWNYIALECEGRVRRMHEEGLEAFLETFGDLQEDAIAEGTPWRMAKLSEPAKTALLRGIVGYELEVGEWRETYKLAQHKSEADTIGVTEGLERESNAALAQAMRASR